jgi:hypothetical protein
MQHFLLPLYMWYLRRDSKLANQKAEFILAAMLNFIMEQNSYIMLW